MKLNLFDPASIRQLEDGRTVYALLYHYELVIGEARSFSGGKIDFALSAPPVLREGITFVPIDFLQKVQQECGLLQGFSVK